MENGERRSVPMVLVLVRGSRMADSFWYIKNCNLFSQLSAADISELESQSRMRKLKRGEAVYLPQDQADGVILVAQGRVKICHATPDGKQSILGFIDSGEIFGELSLLGTERRDEYVETTEKTTLVLSAQTSPSSGNSEVSGNRLGCDQIDWFSTATRRKTPPQPLVSIQSRTRYSSST